MKSYKNFITKLNPNEIFVFGSNTGGFHIGGAARTAIDFGAVMRKAEGIQGNTYAIPTMSLQDGPLSLIDIESYIETFFYYVIDNSDKVFLITDIGCGIAGHKAEDIAPLLSDLWDLDNVRVSELFYNILLTTHP